MFESFGGNGSRRAPCDKPREGLDPGILYRDPERGVKCAEKRIRKACDRCLGALAVRRQKEPERSSACLFPDQALKGAGVVQIKLAA
jgi:hypothetical protein